MGDLSIAPPMEGATGTGYFTSDMKKAVIITVKCPNIDSASDRNNAEESLKQTILPISFPKRPLKIGDSFDLKAKTALPMPSGKPLFGWGTTTYTLKNVTGDLAEFHMAATIDVEHLPMKGSGEGIMVFDMAGNLPKKSSMTANLKFSADRMEGTLTLMATTNYSIQPPQQE
jgi:hypothetical protein